MKRNYRKGTARATVCRKATTLTGYLNITNNYLPKGLLLLALMSVVLMVLMAVVFIAAFIKWYQLLRIKEAVPDAYGDMVLQIVEE